MYSLYYGLLTLYLSLSIGLQIKPDMRIPDRNRERTHFPHDSITTALMKGSFGSIEKTFD